MKPAYCITPYCPHEPGIVMVAYQLRFIQKFVILPYYHPGIELTLIESTRVDHFLSRFSWSYKVSKMGQFRIAKQRYSVGQAVANRYIDARFEPDGRQFAFYNGQTGKLVKRCPAKGLDVAIITGLDIPLSAPGPIQLSFAL